jgi:hypothetical protein
LLGEEKGGARNSDGCCLGERRLKVECRCAFAVADPDPDADETGPVAVAFAVAFEVEADIDVAPPTSARDESAPPITSRR